MINEAPRIQTDVDTLPKAIVGVGTDTQGTPQRRHLEVYFHLTNNLDEVINQLEGLIIGISGEPDTPQPVSEMKEQTSEISLQNFIQQAVSNKVNDFTEEAAKRISLIKEMLF